MKSLMAKERKGQGGFTLIEVLIVILILGAISGLVALHVAGFIGTGECEAWLTERDTVQAAVQACMIDHNGEIPTDLAILVTQKYLIRDPKYDWSIDPTGQVYGTPPEDCYP